MNHQCSYDHPSPPPHNFSQSRMMSSKARSVRGDSILEHIDNGMVSIGDILGAEPDRLF